MNIYKDKIYPFLNKYKYNVILFVFLLTLTIRLRNINISNFLFIISLILSLHILTRVKNIISIIILLIFTIFLTYDSIFAFVFGFQPTVGVFYSILETSTDEATGVFSSIALPSLTFFCLIFFVLLKSRAELKTFHLKIKYSFIILLSIYCSIIFGVYSKFKRSDEYNFKRTNFYLLSVQHIVEARYPLIINDIVSYLSYRNEIHKFEQYKTTKKSTPKGINIELNKNKVTKVIVILGESNSQQYFSLYGYTKAKTTPFLDSLYIQSHTPLSIFDGLASATLTRDAIPFALTFMSPQNREGFNSDKNIIDLAKDNGYGTYWVSNQEQMGIYDTSIGLISTSSDRVFFHGKNNIDDLNLVDDLNRLITADTINQLSIVHLISSHVPYDRYVDKMDETAIDIDEDETGNLNNYLRCIHHTDRVVEDIYKLLLSKSDDFVILYFSDHGEFLPKNHGFTGDHASAQFPIPFFCINNSTVDVASVINSYVDPQSNRINNSNISYIVTELIGYNVSDSLKKKALESNDFVFMADNKLVTYSNLLKSEKEPL